MEGRVLRGGAGAVIWHRAACAREINDQPQEGGALLCADAFEADLSAFFGQAQCVYLDPPAMSGTRPECKVRVGEEGWLTSRQAVKVPAYQDFAPTDRDAYLGELRKLLHLSRLLLNDTGSLFLHVEGNAAAHARLMADEVMGEDNFRNEIIWSYQTGGRSLKYFSRKHDTVLFYAKTPAHFFDITQVPVKRKDSRNNHMKRHVDEKGRSYRTIRTGGREYIYYDDEPAYPDDVWGDVSRLAQKDPQRTGYPSQRPQALLDRMVLSTTRPGDLVVDLMCGSGSALASAAANGRRFLGVDSSPVAFAVCRKRLSPYRLVCQAPLTEAGALLDAAAMPGIGYYTVTLNAFTLPEEELAGLDCEPAGLKLRGMDAVDQWYAGLLNNGVFTAYASALRTRQAPALATSLEVPLLRGTVAVMLIDVLSRRSLWTGTSAV